MWEFVAYGLSVAGLSSVIVTVDSLLGAEATKKRVLLAIFRDEPLATIVRHGLAETANRGYGPVTEVKSRPWSSRRLAALLICITEGLVEEKEGRYVLTEMGRLSFSRPAKKKGERYG